MRYVYIEPSAWVKRYYHETGTALTNHLFHTLLRSRPTLEVFLTAWRLLPQYRPEATLRVVVRPRPAHFPV